jgi:CPA1 family monovalent cation:H+ antiporter
VIATFKEAGATGRLRLLVEAESLFNDGTAAVLFVICLGITSGSGMRGDEIALSFVWTVFGGIGGGLLVGAFVLFLAGQTDDHLIEITFTTVAAYGSFLLAEHIHCSGVLAALSAGLLLGNRGTLGSISDAGHEAVGSFWEYIAFVANSLVFLLMGIRLAHLNYAPVWVTALMAIALVTLGRVVAVYPCCLLFSRTSQSVRLPDQHILFWGGLRGALALALVLGLPAATPRREEITAVAFAVVAFSVIVQGITIGPMLRRSSAVPRSTD